MLEASPALVNEDTPEMRAIARVSTELSRGMEPQEPLSANAQGVAEMFIAPPAFQMSRNAITTPKNRAEPFEPLSRTGQAGTEMLEVFLALNGPCVAEARAFAPTSSEMIRAVEPHEPLSAPDQVVAEMLAAPPALHVFRESTMKRTPPRCAMVSPGSSRGRERCLQPTW
jgi:hypothetical protein